MKKTKHLNYEQVLAHFKGEDDGLDRAFLSELHVRCAIKGQRNVGWLTLEGLARAIKDALKDKVELKAVIKNLQKYVK